MIFLICTCFFKIMNLLDKLITFYTNLEMLHVKNIIAMGIISKDDTILTFKTIIMSLF